MKCITTFLVLMVAVAAISGRRMRRGYDNSDHVISGSDHGQDSEEQNASVSEEGIRACGGVVDKGYDDSPEVAYNRDDHLPAEDHRAGHAYSKSSASASATSSSYNLNHKTNIIPV